jgi:hypothetical protein
MLHYIDIVGYHAEDAAFKEADFKSKVEPWEGIMYYVGVYQGPNELAFVFELKSEKEV